MGEIRRTDGQRYDYISHIPLDGQLNESTIRFDESSKMYVMIRREAGDKMGKLAIANPPYVDDLTWQLRGANLLFLSENHLFMGSRFNQKEGAKTGLFITDLQGVVSNTIALPSGRDNSYPRMVIRDGKLIVAYYSSHEGKSSIYLAKIPSALLQAKGD
ncbi:MAG: hypothetical protein EAS52_12320 [Parapedobacter sp.]|nr:MAG: hypothetical protein EAS52_12320 [Parapedobacter sp.]